MEFGDIIYFILLVFFMILGFFNDSRKKKQQQKKQSEAESYPEVEPHPFFDFDEEPDDEPVVIAPQPNMGTRKTVPPPVPAASSAKNRYDNFQSSLDLVSIQEEPSTLSNYTFDYDANSFYDKDPDSPDIDDTYHGNSKEKTIKSLVHPLIKELREESGREELKKGLVYGEIIQRKY